MYETVSCSIDRAADDAHVGTLHRAPVLTEHRGSAMVERTVVAALPTTGWKIALLVAPPGYGKSVLARQWAGRLTTRVVTVGLDGLGDGAATAKVADAIGVLHDDDVVVALDSAPHLDAPELWESIVDLIERRLPHLRVMITCQVDPPLPIGRWTADGIVHVVRDDTLRFDDVEAIGVAAARRPELTAAAAVELNRLVEGWPLALTLALMAVDGDWRPEGDEPGIPLDALAAAVVDRFPADQRRIALELSAFERFDDTTAVAIVGPAARPVIAELRRWHLVERTTSGVGWRFHGLVRRALDAELRWHDPERHDELHRQAAVHRLRRGEWAVAARHFDAIGDRAAVRELLVQPAVELFDRGDRFGLGWLRARLPLPTTIDDAAVALDVATVSYLAGDIPGIRRWLRRAESIGTPGPLAVRVLATRATLAMLEGDVDTASRDAAAFAEQRVDGFDAGPLEERFGLVAAQLALLRGDTAAAQRWLDEVSLRVAAPVVRDVTIPGLQAWCDALRGLTRRAMKHATAAVERADESGFAHTAVFDAAVAAAWAYLRSGDLGQAERFAARAVAAGRDLGSAWHVARSVDIAAQVQLTARRPVEAVRLIDTTRAQLGVLHGELAAALIVTEAVARWQLGQCGEAIDLLDGALQRCDARLVRAAIALDTGDDRAVAGFLDASETWLLPERLGAAVVLAVARRDRHVLVTAVEEAAAAGFVLPLLRSGRRVDEALLGLALEEIHPAVAEHLRSSEPVTSPPNRRVELTERERSILDLLPSHLSYAGIADHLAISVNTVKGNLKSVYRKLGVSGRAEAVDASRRVVA